MNNVLFMDVKKEEEEEKNDNKKGFNALLRFSFLETHPQYVWSMQKQKKNFFGEERRSFCCYMFTGY